MKENYISQIFYGCFEMFLKENANFNIQRIESIVVVVHKWTTPNDQKDEQPNFDQIKNIINDLIQTWPIEETSIEYIHDETHIKGELVRKNGTPESIIATNFVALIRQMAVEMEKLLIEFMKFLNWTKFWVQ